MNRYTGTAKRVIAAISCAAMVLSNLGSDLQTITAYADETTEQSSTPTGQNQTGAEGQTDENVVAPETEETETPKEEDPSDEGETPKDENSSDEGETPKDEGSSDESETPKDEGSSDEEEAPKDEGSSDEGETPKDEDPSDEDKAPEDQEPSDEKEFPEDEIVTPAEIEKVESDEPTEIDETANITFVAEYIGYYYDYVTDDETGEEVEEQFTKEIADRKTLSIDKDDAYVLEDHAPSIDGWAFDYITIGDEDYYDGARIAIGTDTNEDDNTETIYYTINGDRVDASDEARTIKVTYLYMSSGNEELLTTEYSLAVQYRCGTNEDKSGIFTEGTLAVQYSKDGASWTTITTENYQDLGLSEVPSLNNPTTSSTTDTYKVELPSEYQYRITGILADTTKYVLSYDTKNDLTVTKRETQSVNVIWHDGSDKYKTRVDSETYLKSLTIKGSDGSEYPANLSDEKDPGYVTMEEDGDTWTISFPNLPQYSSSNNEITYTASSGWKNTEKVSTVNGAADNTTYEAEITNEYSNSTTTLYLEPSGKNLSKIEYSLSADTKFEATKKWIDNNGTDVGNRPSVSYALYRYSDNGSATYQDAAIEPSADASLSNETIKSTGGTKGDGTLSAYDADGYLYTYIAKETMTGGKNPYTLSTWNGEQYVAVDDNFVDNGETVYNVIQTTKDLSFTKSFIAKDVQDRNITVEFALERTSATLADGTPDWSKAEMADTSTISGFTEKVTSQSGSFTGLPVEDNYSDPATLGKEGSTIGSTVYYRVVEKTVYLKEGDNVVATGTPNDNGEITLAGVRYQSEQATDEDGNIEIVNRLVGNAEVQINKQFPDGFKNGDTEITPTYTVLRNGEPIGTYQVTYYSKDYQTDENGDCKTVKTNTITKWDDLELAAGYENQTGDLPRYDETGAEYVYTVQETVNAAGYYASITSDKAYDKYTSGDYSGEEYLICKVNAQNHIDDGDPWLHVAKQWNDDSQRMYRADIGFTVEMQLEEGGDYKEIASGTIGQYQTGIFYKMGTDVIRAQFGLSASAWTTTDTQNAYNNWKKAGYPTAATATSIGIRIKETTVQGGITVESYSDATHNNKAHKSDCDFAYANDQQYDVTYTTNQTLEGDHYDLVIVNTRIGTNQIVLDKTWTDGNNYRGKRPAQIKITISASDNVWYDSDNKPLNPATGESVSSDTAAGAVGTERATERVYTLKVGGDNMQISDEGSHWIFTSDDLRKYNDKGEVIYYTASVEAAYDAGGNVLDLAELGYTETDPTAAVVDYGTNHTNDTDTFYYKNEYTGNVNVYVNKIWQDYGSGQDRPDINMVVYRKLKVGESGGENVYGKFNAETGVKDDDGVEYQDLGYISSDWDRAAASNWWKVQFDNSKTPRYNSEGYEWVYFVGEKFLSDNQNDYEPVGAWQQEPRTGDTDSETNVNNFNGSDANKNDPIEWTTKDGKTTVYAVQIDVDDQGQSSSGTLVNRPSSTRSVKGTKTWSASGYRFENDQYPSIKVELYRVTYKNKRAWMKEKSYTDESKVVWNGIFDTDLAEKVTADAVGNVPEDGYSKVLSKETGYNYDWSNLPRYDSEGGKYTYIVKETYATKDDSVDVSVDDIWNQTVDDEGGIKNTFKADQGYTITFIKDWDVKNLDKDSIGSVPIVNIRLVRYLQDANGNPIGNGETAATTTIEFKNYPGTNGVADNATEATQQNKVEWKNLPYYGTNGRPYIYKVEETSKESLGGMKVSTTQPGATIVEDKDNRQTLTKVTVNVVDNYKSGATNDKTGQTELTNEYGSVRGVIKVRKQWIKSTTDDNDLPNLPISTGENKDHLAVRVDRLQYLKNSLIANGQNTAADTDYKVDIEHEITFDLYRNTTSFESSKAESLNTILQLTGDSATNADTLSANNSWTTKIDNLEIYDGAGVQYWYYVKEHSGGSFKVGTYYDEYSGFAGADEDEAKAGTAILVNVPKTETVTARKVWNTQDYANGAWTGDINTNPDLAKLDVLGALPDSITYTVQYRIDNSGEWSTLYEDTAKSTPVTITGTITHATKNAAGEITKAGDYNYKAEYKDLPSYVFTQSGNTITAHEVQYRAIETAMTLSGGSTETVAISDRDESGLLNTDKNGSFNIGAMKASDKVEAAGTNWDGTHYANLTTTTNVIPVRTLKIRKIWDDELNRDGKRPTELTITVTNGSKSATTVINTAVTKALPTVTSSIDNWDDGGAYANYYMNKLGDRPIAQSAVWETSIEVPAGNSIQVTEPAVTGYTSSAFAPNDTSWSDEQTTGVSKTIASDVTDYTVTFANKMWISNQVVIDKTLEEDLAPENLRSQTIRYQLQYKVGENGAWQTVPNDWMTKATVTNGTYDTVAQEIAVTRSNGTYPAVTVKNLPKYDENGRLYRYRVEETDPGSGYAPQYTVDGGRQGDDSFKSEITNRYYTVNATIDKTWYDDFGLNADVQTTVYQLQRREISVANADSNSPLGAALNFLGLDGDVTVPEPTAWTAVTNDDIPGADLSAATMKSDEESLVQVVLTVSEDEQNTTAEIANLIGIKAVEDDYKTYYEYRYVENGMIMQGNDAGKTTEATEHDSAKSNEALAAENGGGTDGGYRLAYSFSDNYGNTFEPDKTFVTHVDAYIQTASIVVNKVWNDKDNYDGIRPNSLSVSLTMNVTHDSTAGSVDYTNSKVAQSGTLVKSESYTNKTTWATVPVSDAYGDKFTYTFDEKCPGGYQKTGYPEPFTTEDGKTYKVSFCNFHYVPDVTPDGGGEDSGEDDPTPVTPTPVPVTPVPEETPSDDTTTEEPADTTERGEHYGDPAYGYFDELGNWHYYDEEGNTSANGETGDDSLMTVYAGAAAASVAVLAAWFVLYRRKREQ